MKRICFAVALAVSTVSCAPDVSQPGAGFSQLQTHPLDHIASGFSHTCGITAGDVFCFGDDSNGQIPDFDPGGLTSSVEYAGIAAMGLLKLGDAVEVAAGTSHTCARRSSGEVACWGNSQMGALGGGVFPDPPPSEWPVTVVGLDDAIQIAVDASGVVGQTSCALRSDHTVACWGAVFGIPHQAEQHATPVAVPGLEDVVSFGVGNAFGCGLVADGGVWCWGANFFRQLGDPALDDTAMILAHRVPGVYHAKLLAVGGEHVCAVLEGGALVCWGRGDNGQIGDGFTGPLLGRHPHVVAAPFTVPLPGPVDAIAASEQATCARIAGSVACWGGVGTQDGTATTVPVVIQDLANAKEVSTGVDFGCAVDGAHHTRCWGDNAFGQVGVDNADPHAQFFATPIDLGF